MILTKSQVLQNSPDKGNDPKLTNIEPSRRILYLEFSLLVFLHAGDFPAEVKIKYRLRKYALCVV